MDSRLRRGFSIESAGERVGTKCCYSGGHRLGCPAFVKPRPRLSVVEKHIVALERAQVRALTRADGAAKARDARRAVVQGDLEALRSYVQLLITGNPAAEGAAIVAGAGMNVKNARGPDKLSFTVKQLRQSGSVHLYVRAVRGAVSYEWEYCIEGAAWIRLPPTVRADTRVNGLDSGASYSFRYRAMTKAGLSDWSDPVRLLVI